MCLGAGRSKLGGFVLRVWRQLLRIMIVLLILKGLSIRRIEVGREGYLGGSIEGGRKLLFVVELVEHGLGHSFGIVFLFCTHGINLGRT